jgi:hypothetical protein
MMTTEKIYAAVEDKYFASNDFNGLPIRDLAADFDIASPAFRSAVRSAILSDIITARVGGNPHILAFSSMPKEQVLEAFDNTESLADVCLYPHRDRLQASLRLGAYSDRPYALELARGGGQFDFRTFDLAVLEQYRNDPRYSYETDFIHGQICIESAYYESAGVPEHDRVLLQTFGFAYDNDLNRYVAVYLRYLSDLSPEHQRIWAAREVKGDIRLHPDYFDSTINGSWGSRLSIFEAFTMELEIVNEMSKLMGKPGLFRNTFTENRPTKFGFLLRPTAAEFNDFTLLLDKMMSENLNKDFFRGDMELETENVREDGKIVVQPKGTVTLLAEWFSKKFRAVDDAPIREMVAAFKEVRKLRQQPAHALKMDTFDQAYFKTQRDLIIKSYDAVRTIRQAFANHPAVKRNPPEISEQLFNGDIWDI